MNDKPELKLVVFDDTPQYIITKRLVQRLILGCIVILFALIMAHVSLKTALNVRATLDQLEIVK